ncbi:hypothetical protein [Modestobacter sp. KNN46-3]|uniref:hypothetical protein n=1 Tax=Modestobacter sp. KNN46-3 TaxID=2711218 RepID=UPI0013E0951B|nr:hypothetical protein [Modestobacter sp. KNN46-3]
MDQPWSAASQASASADTRVPAVSAPVPPGARRPVSSIFSARSAAAREAAVLETSRTSPSKSRNFTRALTRPLGMVANKIVPLVPSGSGGRPTGTSGPRY